VRKLCVRVRHWLEAREFEDATAACDLLPGPTSTHLAIVCAGRSATAFTLGRGSTGPTIPASIRSTAVMAPKASSSVRRE
jgi:chromate transport protein ChrA